MAFISNTIAKRLITHVEELIVEKDIRDPSKIHVFLDDSDITQNPPSYLPLLLSGKIEEAFALPKVPTPFSEPIIRNLWRLGVRIHLYTSRVDTARLKKTAESIMVTCEVPDVFSSYTSLRDEENKVIDFEKIFQNETILPNDKSNHVILYCSFGSRVEQFKTFDLSSSCETATSILMDEV